MARIEAGVARADVTPPVGVAHSQWRAREHERARGVDLPLFATVLAIRDGERTALVVDLDLVNTRESDVAAIRDRVSSLTDVPVSNVRVSFTHTHAGPDMLRDTSREVGTDVVQTYLESLPDYVAGSAMKATENVRPATVVAGSGESRIAVNRRYERPEDGEIVVGRNWEGSVDHDVPVVRIDDAERGDPIAAIANYACHPIAVGPDCKLLSPDYPGVVRRVVEDATDATCLFLQGAGGNIGPVRGVAENGLEEYRPLGRRLGHEVSRVWWALDDVRREERYVETLESGAPLAVYEDERRGASPTPLRVASRDLPLPLRVFPSANEFKDRYERHAERADELRGRDKTEARRHEMLAKQARIRKRVAEEFRGESTHEFELHVVALGTEVAFAAIPGEPYSQIGEAVKDRSPFETTLFSGYTNAGWNYIPTEDAYDEGGFTVEITPFDRTAADVVVSESVDLLKELYPTS